ncbi:DNA-binding transcriptional regulator, HxlR family [Mesobacillus persicus]|uniref:DNA-binding transcriptional regulator, HxlR family n=1 Tax=Mesobacillus persicus TaxID=930146 RepID=A0A1H8IRA2_9BACI|nr:helix-turn-helix domain-containing protein [Mesobacillus persicus]SEN71094.1 DNA-binding transcriptional regulator, HxlR family [Mesobacillus persicus]
MEKKPELCQVEDALGILVGKWKPIILLYLLQQGTKRFSELKRSLPGITQKMLTKQLRELEDEDIIERVVYPQVPPKVEYSITEYGRTLEPILEAMHEWGKSHTAHKRKKSQQQLTEINKLS